MKQRLLLATFLGLTTSVSQAATVLGADIGAYVWASDIKASTNTTTLNGDTDTSLVFFAALEHPLPFVPNVKLTYSNISQTTDNKTAIDASHTDFTLYYEVLDNWVSLDLGLAGRKHDGETKKAGIKTNINSTLAMAYAKLQFDIPNTDIGIGTELYQGMGSGDEKVSDINLFVNYNVALGFTIGAGYRRLDTDLDIKNTTTTLVFDGAYLAASYHF